MTNINAPAGANITNSIQSAVFKPTVTEYVIPASDTTDYFLNDFVRTNETSENGTPICVKAAAGEVLRGIIVGFKPDATYQNTLYRKGGTRRIAYVNEDPFITFVIQASGTLASTDIGKNGDILVGTGSVSSGLSGTQIDQSTLSTGTGQLKILRIVDDPINELGQYTKVICMIYEHELNSGAVEGTVYHNSLLNLSFDTANHGVGKDGFQRGTTNDTVAPTVNDDDSQGYRPGDLWVDTNTDLAYICLDASTGAAVWHEIEHSASDIWDRSGTTIQPSNAGDDLNMGTGNVLATDGTFTGDVSGVNGTFTGKLTVTGSIDPTDLQLTPQATEPATADGTIYYDSVQQKFLFREAGGWDTISATGVWDRTGTTISVKNAGDDVDFSTAGLVKSAQFDSSNIAYYDSHPSFTADTDIVDKKYVDEAVGLIGQKDVLTVTTPGQTAFTLSTTPVNTDTMFAIVRNSIYDYGNAFTVSGTALTWLDPDGITLETTDRFVVIYDYDLSGSPFTQYWQKSGNTLSPVTGTDDLNIKDIEIGKSASGAIDGKTDIAVSLTSAGTGNLTVSATGSGDVALSAAGGGNVTVSSAGAGTVTVSSTGTGNTDIDSTGGTLSLSSSNPIVVNQSINSSNILEYSSHPTFTADTDIVDKKYVDDSVSGEDIWDRTGTTISVKNSGDTVDFASSPVIFDSANIPAYDLIPTLSDDKQVVHKKYVDDHTILEQQNVFYVSKAGSDSNDGKSVDTPFLTISYAMGVIDGLAPGPSDRFRVEVLDSDTYTETVNVSVYTTLVGSATIVGLLILTGERSDVEGINLVGRLSQTDVDGTCFVKLPKITNSSDLCVDQTIGTLYLECPLIERTGSGFAISNTGGILNVTADKITASNGIAVQDNAYLNIKQLISTGVTGVALDISTGGAVTGTINSINATHNALVLDNGSFKGTIDTLVGNVSIGTTSTLDAEVNQVSGSFSDDGSNTISLSERNIPAFRAQASAVITQNNVTGSGTQYVVKFDNDSTGSFYDTRGTYHNGASQNYYEALTRELWEGHVTVRMVGFSSTTTNLKLQIVQQTAGGSYVASTDIFDGDPRGLARHSGTISPSDVVTISGTSGLLKVDKGHRVKVFLTVDGAAIDSVSVVSVITEFSGKRVRTI